MPTRPGRSFTGISIEPPVPEKLPPTPASDELEAPPAPPPPAPDDALVAVAVEPKGVVVVDEHAARRAAIEASRATRSMSSA
jgi:hypothetical protein